MNLSDHVVNLAVRVEDLAAQAVHLVVRVAYLAVQASDHVVRAVHLAVQVVKLSAQEAGPDQHVVEPDSLGPKKALRHSEPIWDPEVVTVVCEGGLG